MNRFFVGYLSKFLIETSSPRWLTCAAIFACILSTGCWEFSNPTNDEQRDPYYLRAQKLEAGSNFAEAAEAYEKALVENPQNASAHFRLCFLNEQSLTNYAAAIYHGEKFVKMRPKSEFVDLVNQHIQFSQREISKALPEGLMTTPITRKMDQLVQTNSILRQRIADLEQQNSNHLHEISVIQRSLAAATNQLAAYAASIKAAEQRKMLSTAVGNSAKTLSPSSIRSGSTAKIYRIQSGDNLSKIAQIHGVSVTALKAANPKINPKRLKIGQNIKIP